jgi:hypothetical protein
MPVVMEICLFWDIRRGADKFLAFPISYLQHNQKIFFSRWVKVRTNKS